MNLPSNADAAPNLSATGYPLTASGSDTMSAFVMPPNSVTPFEFRSLTCDEEATGLSSDSKGVRSFGADGKGQRTAGRPLGQATTAGHDRATSEEGLRGAVDAARQQGEALGRAAARAELEAEMNLSRSQERARVSNSLDLFRIVKDRYFTEVEQEIVRLTLAIAARVLHREAQIDPLLLSGVVRVALEKMADRSGVVMRVASADVEAWEHIFLSTEATERPKVVEDCKLERGECVLDTKMGTVELGVRVQLEEIEKGFFDLLNHRPVQ